MEQNLTAVIISGVFSVIAALGSVWLKHQLEQFRSEASPLTETSRERSTSGPRAFSLIRSALVLIVAFAAGAIYCYYKTPPREIVVVPAFYLFTVVAFLGLVLAHRRHPNGIWSYELDCFAFWAAFLSGFSVIFGQVWSDAFLATAMFWLFFAVVGGLIVLLTRPKHRSRAQ